MHAPTLAAAVATAVALQAIALVFVWFAQFRDRAVAELAVGAIVTAIGALLALSRPTLHPIVTHVVATALVVGGQTLVAFALGRFVGRGISPVLVWGLPVLVGALIAYFLFVTPRQDIRIAVYSFGVVIASTISARVLLDVPRGPLRLTHRPTGILFLLQAVLGLARGIWVLADGASDSLFDSSPFQIAWFYQAVVLVNAIFIGLVLVITQRPRLELDRQARYDLLTDTLNRDAFERHAAAEWSDAVEHGRQIAVLILEPDRFKALNDAYGADVGDAWLKAFAATVRATIRPEDTLCRYRDREFTVLLPQMGTVAAELTAERIRKAVENVILKHGGADVASTVSVGLAARSGELPDLKSVIAAADRALYRAKARGRNRVETAVGR